MEKLIGTWEGRKFQLNEVKNLYLMCIYIPKHSGNQLDGS